jgi:hypothetical protein
MCENADVIVTLSGVCDFKQLGKAKKKGHCPQYKKISND